MVKIMFFLAEFWQESMAISVSCLSSRWQNGPGNGIIGGMSKSFSDFRESKNK